MSAAEHRALDLLARLVEDRPNIYAGICEDCHGNFCLYCGARSGPNRPRPDHRWDCPIEQGQQLLARIYGDQDQEDQGHTQVREIPVEFPG